MAAGTPTSPIVPTGGRGEGGPFDFSGADGGGGGVGPRDQKPGGGGTKVGERGKGKRRNGPSMQSIPPIPEPAEAAAQLETTAAPVALAADSGGMEAPSTPVLLLALGLLAAALAAGFFWYRDQLP